jgi:hypothetical protein
MMENLTTLGCHITSPNATLRARARKCLKLLEPYNLTT